MTRPLALLSVSDKTGLVDLAQQLVGAGFEILSTGGSAAALAAAGVPVTKVSDYTGAPEIFGGRVKTLHPRIHGGILGRRGVDDPASADLRWIDVVVVNLYPFEATVSGGGDFAECVENIDIGGPSMVRSSAKNHESVLILTDPADYPEALARRGDPDFRRRMALKAFRHTAFYDAMIARWLEGQLGEAPDAPTVTTPMRRLQSLRYGENPHQKASYYADPGATGRALGRARQLQGKELSFNNVADWDATLRVAFEYDAPACAIVKHMNPCGAAVHPEGVARAFALALSADPVSAFGGIVAFNRPLSADDVRAVLRSKVFFEVLTAPGIAPEGQELLKKRENLRVMELPADWAQGLPPGQDARRVQGGWLLQDWDVNAPLDWKVATSRAPTEEESAALRFAWAACRNVKSNAIVLARAEEGGFVLNGTGAGQMSRVDSVKLAVAKAQRPTAGSVLASDAFFPFADGVEAAAAAGVSAIIQPGGSIRDAEVLEAAEKAGIAMVFTGARHFRH